MFKKIVAVLLGFVLLIGTVCASSNTTNVTVDTTVINTPYLDVTIWILMLLLGIMFLVLSHIPSMDRSSAIWAVLAPFFTFTATFFSRTLQYTNTEIFYDSGTYKVVTEYSIYHLDWLAVGVLGVLFLFSFINVFYVASRKPITKPQAKEVYGVPKEED